MSDTITITARMLADVPSLITEVQLSQEQQEAVRERLMRQAQRIEADLMLSWAEAAPSSPGTLTVDMLLSAAAALPWPRRRGRLLSSAALAAYPPNPVARELMSRSLAMDVQQVILEMRCLADDDETQLRARAARRRDEGMWW